MGHPIEELLDSWMEMMSAMNELPHTLATHPRKNSCNDGSKHKKGLCDCFQYARPSIGDWEDRDGDVAITIDMPGIQKKDIELTVDKHSVRVVAKTEDRDYSFTKDMTSELNPDKVTAKFNNGVLDITIQKAEESKGKKIAVK